MCIQLKCRSCTRMHPWQMTPVQMQDLNSIRRDEANKAERHARPSGKKGLKERQYQIEDLRAMASAVLSGTQPNAHAAAMAAGLPSAERTLRRYLKEVAAQHAGNEQMPARDKQIEGVQEMEFKRKGQEDLTARRLFTNDELDYFKRALKLYSEMGWPLDYQQIRCMFSHACG
ncbi:hypothetical protein AB1Y20_001225 [Prymnesium parvum]|uniref:Uncharacterized protein n=1 Tax=Prymnesium parvum TaxID=97485 RepID=A0AB34K7P9_PRYPA